MCPRCARSAKFCMSANIQILVLALFHKFLGFQSFLCIWNVPCVTCHPFSPISCHFEPLELGIWTLNPRSVVWPLELGIWALNPRSVAWPLELGIWKGGGGCQVVAKGSQKCRAKNSKWLHVMPYATSSIMLQLQLQLYHCTDSMPTCTVGGTLSDLLFDPKYASHVFKVIVAVDNLGNIVWICDLIPGTMVYVMIWDA